MTRSRAQGPLLIVGDALLDIDVDGVVERLSPDAPVPVLDQLVERARPGGAALAALMAVRDGHDVVLVTAIGADSAGDQLRALLSEVRVILVGYDGPTAVKRRIRAGSQAIARLDSGSTPGSLNDVPAEVRTEISEAAGILVADYGRGLSSLESLRLLLSERPRRVPLVWDPHPRGAQPIPGAQLVTPNRGEAKTFGENAGIGTASAGLAAVAADASGLAKAWQARAVAVTMGSRGALLAYAEGAPCVTPAPAVDCIDSCGAGDRFAVSAAVALASGLVTTEAVQAAVQDATTYVAQGGPGTLSTTLTGAARAAASLPQEQADREPDGVELALAVRRAGGVVVATGGCFDLLHAGHIATLQAARGLGECLIVCLNSDDSVRRLKGAGRPLVPMADRKRVLSALGCVDAVVIFDENTPVEVLQRLRPDVWVKGGDYAGEQLPEAAVLDRWGGKAVSLPYVSGRSTTQLVQSATQSLVEPLRTTAMKETTR